MHRTAEQNIKATLRTEMLFCLMLYAACCMLQAEEMLLYHSTFVHLLASCSRGKLLEAKEAS